MRLLLQRGALNEELATITAGLTALQKVAFKQHHELQGTTDQLDHLSNEFEILSLSAEVYRLDAEYWKAEAIKARGLSQQAGISRESSEGDNTNLSERAHNANADADLCRDFLESIARLDL